MVKIELIFISLYFYDTVLQRLKLSFREIQFQIEIAQTVRTHSYDSHLKAVPLFC